MLPDDGFRILVIDDNPEIHKDFIKILTAIPPVASIGYLDKQLFGEEHEPAIYEDYSPKFQVDTASQGEDAIVLIKKALRERRPYAVAFVDIRMPLGWNGIETIKHIWALSPEIQVVICTAFSDYSWEETVNELGATDNLFIVKKPFDIVAIRQFASALTIKWLSAQDTKKHTQFLNKIVKSRNGFLSKCFSLIRSILTTSSDGIIIVDNEDKVVDYNRKFMEMWGIQYAMMEKKDYKKIEACNLNKIINIEEFLEKIRESKRNLDMNWVSTIALKNGSIFEVCSQPYRLKTQVVGRGWSFRDITQRSVLEKNVVYLAMHDSLTELPNREFLMDRLRQAILRAVREKNGVGLLFFDLDNFKMINDTFGHDVGDELLRAMAKRLMGILRAEDSIARFGGDEFVIVVAGLKHSGAAMVHIANIILLAMREPFTIAGHEITLLLSIGISLYPKDSTKAEELLHFADRAMYQAKKLGGNQFQFYTDDLV